jgi:hypothetical protein
MATTLMFETTELNVLNELFLIQSVHLSNMYHIYMILENFVFVAISFNDSL